jgi:hypothetical protein
MERKPEWYDSVSGNCSGNDWAFTLDSGSIGRRDRGSRSV